MRYVLLTAAKNEAAFIEHPLELVVRQTVLPLRWVIVSDGSSDGTDDIVKRYASRYPFIELVRREGAKERDFRSKAIAIRRAYERVKELTFGYVGNLDADISFAPTYYERTLGLLQKNPRMGLITGRRYEQCCNGFKLMAPNMISGAVQLFRRECWEEVGGYLPLRYGGEDTVATIMARMKNWQLDLFADPEVYHHREMGAAQGGLLRRHYRDGAQAHAIGYHPLFYIAMTVRDAARQAMLIGPIASILGYTVAACKRRDRCVPEDLVWYVRLDQMAKMRLQIRQYCGLIKRSP